MNHFTFNDPPIVEDPESYIHFRDRAGRFHVLSRPDRAVPDGAVPNDPDQLNLMGRPERPRPVGGQGDQ